jgi:hypothetical protein
MEQCEEEEEDGVEVKVVRIIVNKVGPECASFRGGEDEKVAWRRVEVVYVLKKKKE